MSDGLKQLSASSHEAAYRFCERTPDRSAYIAGWINEGGLLRSTIVPRAWLLGEHEGDKITGLIYVSGTGIVMPVVESTRALDHLADLARTNPNALRVIVGERRIVGELWARLKDQGMEARMMRDQLGYSVERRELAAGEDLLELQTAGTIHLDQVVAASAAMAREEAQDDPQSRNPELFRNRISERLARGRDFVNMVKGELWFKCNVAALSPLGGQVEGIYTAPARRHQGIGRRGTATVTAWVLERAQRAVLLVNEDNAGARRLYEALGYRPTLESRTIFVAP